MRLTEITNEQERLQRKMNYVQEWIHAHPNIKEWRITPHNTIIVSKGDVIAHHEKDLPPLKLEQVAGSVDFSHSLISDFSLMPKVVGGDCILEYCNIKHLHGAPSFVGGRLLLGNTQIESFQNIHKTITHIGSTFYIPATVKSHMLGVLLMKHPPIAMIMSAMGGVYATRVRGHQAMLLLNSHLKTEIDVHDAQQELIDRGLEEFARL